MDPFGDSQPVEGDVPAVISDFAPPADNTGEYVQEDRNTIILDLN